MGLKKNCKMTKSIAKVITLIFAFVLIFTIEKAPTAFAKQSKNDYPIVLCHGCNGWGRDENFGALAFQARYYWGGNVDLQQELINRGNKVYTAAVGPLSSNWDRACELYAEIKGGTVDYGEAHSKKHGHKRFGRTYVGFCPEWGTKDDNGNISKVHLVGHSQGGQTVRVLSQLVSKGSEEERKATGNDISELFKGDHSWISGVVTLATPHDGTTLADLSPTNKLGAIGIAAVGTVLGDIPNSNIVFDLKVDQWGLKRKSNETLLSYIKRCEKSNMWASNDTCAVDLSTDGAVQQNRWVKAQPDVYYFSWACCGTKHKPFSMIGHQIADLRKMGDKKLYSAQWILQANFMGRYGRINDRRHEIRTIDKKWWPNDGYVNTISEDGPEAGSDDVIVNYNGTPQVGKWNFMGVKDMDHEDIIGRNWSGAKNFFVDMADMLHKLP